MALIADREFLSRPPKDMNRFISSPASFAPPGRQTSSPVENRSDGWARQISSPVENTASSMLNSFISDLCQHREHGPADDRLLEEAQLDGEVLRDSYTNWIALHPQRAKESEKCKQQGLQRVTEFEDDGTVDALMLAFMRETQIWAQAPDRPVPNNVHSKLVHLVRHGQGFHNMLEAQPHGEDGLTSAEGEIDNTPEIVKVEGGASWTVVCAHDAIFTSALGPRKVIGIETEGAAEFVLAWSKDNCETWTESKELLRVPNAKSPEKPQKQCPFGLNGKKPKNVMCTHVRVRPTKSDAKPMGLKLLVPAVAREELVDPSLTAKGRREAQAAHNDAVYNNVNPEVVIVSPVTRATQTALIGFQHLLDADGKPKVPFIAHEGVHERGGENTCDCRRSLRELKWDFPNVDYSLIENEKDPFWSPVRESQGSMIKRLYGFLLWLRDRPEKEVAIVAHCSINFTLLNAVVDCSIDPEMARWFCTAETRTFRLLWQDGPEESFPKFIDDAKHTAGLADGLSLMYPNARCLPGSYMSDRGIVTVRRDVEDYVTKGHVGVVLVGGAGHEPCLAGFLGKGLLTAAASGGLFETPPVAVILRAIQAAVGYQPGQACKNSCVLLVLNYPGGVFNNGVAAAKAAKDGIKVTTVLIADDVAHFNGSTGRGVAGSVLVLKAAGASAESGSSLEAVTAAAANVASKVRTMGLAQRDTHTDSSHVDIGVGIHGEPGFKTVPSMVALCQLSSRRSENATASAEQLLNHVLPRTDLKEGDRAVLVVNNLGGLSELEMAVLTNASHKLVEERGITIAGFVSGTMVTCLDMRGWSLSLLPLAKNDDSTLQLLTSPVGPYTAWPGLREGRAVDPLIMSDVTEEPDPQRFSTLLSGGEGSVKYVQSVRDAIKAACYAMTREETVAALDAMDKICGDGDCGTGHRIVGLAVLEMIDSFSTGFAHELLACVAALIEESGSGAIGGIYAVAVLKLAQEMQASGQIEPDALAWARAARAALESIKECGDTSLGDRTVVDAMEPALKAFEQHVSEGGLQALAAASKEAIAGAKGTQVLVAKKGRAQYMQSKQYTQRPDPGAVGFAKIIEGVYKFARERGQ